MKTLNLRQQTAICVAVILGATVLRGISVATPPANARSLRSLEHRAIEAQALAHRVEELELLVAFLRSGGNEADYDLPFLPVRVSPADPRSLRGVEQQALQAGALQRQIEQLRQQLSTVRDEKKEMESEMDRLRDERDAIALERDRIQEEWEALKRVRDRQEHLLALCRSGDFEYYQVQAGDTVESIAANPMVYGDSQRAIWIKHANALEPDTPLTVGTVLLIPRFPQGMLYDL